MEQRESLEIVIFRHLAWRPERFQLQLKKRSLGSTASNGSRPTGRPPWAWCSKVQDASGASTIDAIEAAETLRLATDWEIRDFLADLTPNNAKKIKEEPLEKAPPSYAQYAFFFCRMPLDRGHFGAS
jgi:hypothetical protein